MQRLVVILILILARSAAAQSYTVFDLADGKIDVPDVPANTTVKNLPGLGKCDWSLSAANVLTFKRNTDETCKAIFETKAPGDLEAAVRIPNPPPAGTTSGATVVVRFDRDAQPIAKAKIDAARRRIDLEDNRLSGELAYYSATQGTWVKIKFVAGGKSSVVEIDAPDAIADGTATYLKPDTRTEVIRVTLVDPPPPPSNVPENVGDTFETTCEKELKAAETRRGWYTKLDAKDGNTLAILKPPGIVDPNTFGHVIVRHTNRFVVNLTSSGGTIGLYEPPFRNGQGQSGGVEAIAGSRASQPSPKLVCTDYEVAPRRPGAYAITVKLVDPTADPEKNTVSSQPVDVVVLDRYAGAFRMGIAAIFGPADQKFEARTMPGSMQAEIVRTSRTPFELVIGYSHFLLAPEGRRYFSKATGAPEMDSNWGLFLGFGALTFDGDKVDFLKSMHVGIEYEVTPNLAIAVTGVVRRVDELTDGARVGAPAASSIPTETRYRLGGAVVLNISPAFFKFATSIGK